jgi:sugar/nucleoside kinase (ribokinase family)
MSLDVLTFGEALVEVMRAERDVPFDVPGAFVGPYPSGAPFIFAVQAARLGAKAGSLGCVGAQSDGTPDAFGKCLLDQLIRDGVETRCVLAQPGYTTGVAFIAYDSGGGRDYVFHLRHAAAGQLDPALLDLPALDGLFDGLKCLHLTGSSLSINAGALALGLAMLEKAQQAGAKISFDPNFRPQLLDLDRAQAAFAPFMAAADVILPTADEAMLLTGESTAEAAGAALAASRSGRIVVMSEGERGCTVYSAAGAAHVPGFAVKEVDPTGAGDCFDAGFLVRWLAGDPPLEAARYANACGALAVTARGPMAGAQRHEVVEAFIKGQ